MMRSTSRSALNQVFLGITHCCTLNDHIYRMVKERYSNIWPNQTNVSDQSELTILLCQPMNSLLLMKTTLPWYSGLQLLPSYIYDPCAPCNCLHWVHPASQTSSLHLLILIVIWDSECSHHWHWHGWELISLPDVCSRVVQPVLINIHLVPGA